MFGREPRRDDDLRRMNDLYGGRVPETENLLTVTVKLFLLMMAGLALLWVLKAVLDWVAG